MFFVAGTDVSKTPCTHLVKHFPDLAHIHFLRNPVPKSAGGTVFVDLRRHGRLWLSGVVTTRYGMFTFVAEMLLHCRCVLGSGPRSKSLPSLPVPKSETEKWRKKQNSNNGWSVCCCHNVQTVKKRIKGRTCPSLHLHTLSSHFATQSLR